MSIEREITLDDKYNLNNCRVLLSGVQALVRLPLEQRAKDVQAGLNTAGFISGYRGSPISGYDISLWRAAKHLEQSAIRFVPGVNEDLAATACLGTQQLDNYGDANVDGVFALWYGKGPGIDRAGDAIKHGNYAGTHPHGGVLVVFGDDHPGKSSTIAHQSEIALAANSVPVLYPATLQDILHFGLIGWAMSRYSGLWAGLKLVNETLERTETVDLDTTEVLVPQGEAVPPEGIHFIPRRYNPPLDEMLVKRHRLPRAIALAKANKVDETLVHGSPRRLGIVTAGKSYLDVRRAIALLGLSLEKAADLGIGLYKVGMIWPLDPEGLRQFAAGYDEVLFIEEKAAFMEQQAGRILYDLERRPRLSGKETPEGEPLLAVDFNLEAVDVARAIVNRAEALGLNCNSLLKHMTALDARLAQGVNCAPVAGRSPFFCAGCPHNTSTRLPEGSIALAGIGCHGMATMYREDTKTFTQMGGEGANWIGATGFTKTKHVFQNMGDGTYYHSGYMAIRAAIAAGVNITYKILLNDAVAMTGGQPVDGPLSAGAITHQMKHEGAREIVVVSDDPDAFTAASGLAAGVQVHHRDHLDSVQRRLREIEGVTVIIFVQTCAAEKRRRRKKGILAAPRKWVFINPLVCEDCGDCSAQSTCLAVVPQDTTRGEKRQIDQSACNEDFSCLKGFCPSFVSLSGTELNPLAAEMPESLFADIPMPSVALTGASYSVMIAGVGGTGVVTIGAVLAMAALFDGNYATCYDMTGLSQKGGSVFSHLRVAREKDELLASRLGVGDADLLLAFDMLAAQGKEAIQTVRRGRTRLVGNSTLMPTVMHVLNAGLKLDSSGLRQSLTNSVGADQTHLVNAAGVAAQILGDSIGGNMFLLGYAAQLGFLPVSVDALRNAISLNAIAVPFNLRALELGRLHAHAPQRLQPYITAEQESTETMAQDLDAIVARETEWLTAYQNRAYAKRYQDMVEQARAADQSVANQRPEFALAVARTFGHLLAYKDEYEVARLYTETDFILNLQAKFKGPSRLRLHLAPPMLARRDKVTGQPRKMEFGEWVLPLLKVMAKLRRLRGSRLDIFGFTRERRMQRQWIEDYEALIGDLCQRLTAGNYATAVELAGLARGLKGFGHVKQAKFIELQARQQQLLTQIQSAIVK